ncbi:lipid A-modifier LpxR family protein [Ascidiimonas sp. W6]|uniref:lipid A-modifier LpxR family protein n=1 Tax=Ascidiimonas meishanensis TaxID=3128903 RepID=UPI0030EEBB92
MTRLLYLLFLVFSVVFSQETNFDQQFSLQHDNDVLTGSDRYYSMGLFFRYKRELNSTFIFPKPISGKLQLNLMLSMKGYTPDKIDENDSSLFDHPYAGWLYIEGAVVSVKRNQLITIGLQLGITGKPSLAGELQRWYHRFAGIDSKPNWSEQISPELMTNVIFRYVVDIPLGTIPAVFISLNNKAALGTKDIFTEPGILLSVGRRSNLRTSSLFGMIGNSASENYLYLGTSYRFVVHNSLIEGSWLNNNAPFTLHPEKGRHRIIGGISLHKRHSTYKIEYNYISRPTPQAGNHDFMKFIFEYNF